MRVLLTGANGFIGGHMAEALLAESGHTLFGISRDETWPATLLTLYREAAVRLIAAELGRNSKSGSKPYPARREAGVDLPFRRLRQHRQIVQRTDAMLAGQSRRHPLALRCRSRQRPEAANPLREHRPDLRRSEETTRPFDETAEFRPASPYAASKAATDAMSYQYTRHPGLDIVRVRLFNQIGPRQSADYAIANFARHDRPDLKRESVESLLETGDLSARAGHHRQSARRGGRVPTADGKGKVRRSL